MAQTLSISNNEIVEISKSEPKNSNSCVPLRVQKKLNFGINKLHQGEQYKETKELFILAC